MPPHSITDQLRTAHPGGSERADHRSSSPVVGATDHSAYYNEHDPFAAAWLRELMADGLIAPGVVDERSIEDVRPDELAGFRQCHFFAGIGVWSLALRSAGWPDDRPVWTGSCPCQPFSAAGKGGGFADERHLWPAFHWLIHQCRPELVFGEQVASKDGLAWLDLVSADLEASGYASGAVDTCAAGFGAPHIRQRLYWVAYAASSGQPGQGGCSRTQDGRAAERRVGDGLAHTLPAGWAEGWPFAGSGQTAGIGGALGLADAVHLGHERGGAARGRRDGLPHGGDARGLADADGGHPRAEGIQRGGKQRQLAQDGGAGGLGNAGSTAGERHPRTLLGAEAREHGARFAVDGCQPVGPEHAGPSVASRPGPTNGLWRDADWLGCTDGKWRPVEPSPFSMADARTIRRALASGGGTGGLFHQPLAQKGEFRNRARELRGAGNAVNLAQASEFASVVREMVECR